MTALLESPTVTTVGGNGDDIEEGRALKERREALGWKLRPFSEWSGINRSTLASVEAGGARMTSVSTYRAALDRLEHEMGMDMPDADEEPNELDLVEFQVAGNFGVRVVVKGPVRDRRELEETVLRLVAGMAGEGDQNPAPPTSP